MGEYNIVICILGIIYGVYSIIFRNKVTFYYTSYGVVLLNKEAFLKLQLYFSIINSIFLIISGLIITILNLNMNFVWPTVIIFGLINSLFRVVAKRKKYIQFN